MNLNLLRNKYSCKKRSFVCVLISLSSCAAPGSTTAQVVPNASTQGVISSEGCNLNGKFAFEGEETNLKTGEKKRINRLQASWDYQRLENAAYFEFKKATANSYYALIIKNPDGQILKTVESKASYPCIGGKQIHESSGSAAGDGNPQTWVAKGITYVDTDGSFVLYRWRKTSWTWINARRVSEEESEIRFPAYR